MEVVRGEQVAQDIVGLHESVRMDELGDFFPRAMTAAGEALAARGVDPAGLIHHGSYDDLSNTYEELTAWFKENGMTPPTVMWEEYLVGPESGTDPSRWRTRIVYPVG